MGEGQYDKTLSPPDKRRGGRGRRAGGASSGAPTPRSGGPTPRSSIAASSPRSKARVPSLPTSQNSSPRRRGGAGAGQVATGVAVAAAVGVVAGVEAAGEDVEEEYDEDFDEMDESTVASGPQVFHPKTVLLAPECLHSQICALNLSKCGDRTARSPASARFFCSTLSSSLPHPPSLPPHLPPPHLLSLPLCHSGKRAHERRPTL